MSDAPRIRLVDTPSPIEIEESSHIWLDAESLRVPSPPDESYLEDQRCGFVVAMSRADAWLSVAVDEASVVGLVGGFSSTSKGPDAYLAYIAVAAERRRQGIGRLLLERAVARATTASATRMLLTVHETNTSARNLYERAGWRLTGRREFTPIDEEPLLEYAIGLRTNPAARPE